MSKYELDPLVEKYLDENIQLDELDRLSSRYKRAGDNKAGRKEKSKILDTIADSIVNLSKYILDEEIKAAQEASGNLGVDFLVTDSVGSRSIRQLECGNPFATGVASRCVAAAVTHNEIGMGAAHKNSVSRTNIRRASETFLNSSGPNSLKLVERMNEFLVTPPNSIKQTISETLAEALIQFRSLIPGMPLPQEGLHIMASGLYFLEPQRVSEMEMSLRESIGRSGHFNDGSLLGRERSISLLTDFGNKSGIIWGGLNHSTYPEPAFYSLSSK